MVRQRPDTDHDMLLDMWPRLEAEEQRSLRNQAKIDTLELAVTELTHMTQEGFHKLETQLSSQISEGLNDARKDTSTQFDQIENHLNEQDESVNKMRVSVAGARAYWPRAAVVFVTISGTALGLAIVQLMMLGHW